MNTFFQAVQERGDFWRNALEGKQLHAHIRNSISTNAALLDNERMTLCEAMPAGDVRRFFQKMEKD